MPKRYWLFVIAIGLVWSTNAPGDPPPKQAVDAKTQHEVKSPDSGPATKESAERPDYHQDACYDAEAHDSADLCAQWRAALAAEKAAHYADRANLIGLIGIVLSFIGTVLVVVALSAARTANRIARSYR